MRKIAEKCKAALVTGAAQRIGAELALTLAEQGYDIALHYHRSRTEAEKTAIAIRKLGRACKLYAADLGRAENAKKMIAKVFKDFPQLEILVNNASIFKVVSFLETSVQSFDENFNLHLKSPFLLMQAFAHKVKKGQVINLIDSKVKHNSTTHFAYLLSKKSLLQLTEMAALALAPHIRVNAIAPGAILPPSGKSPTYLKKIIEKTPLKKAGTLGEIRQALLCLLYNPSLTGQCIYVDGGLQLI